MLAFKRKAVFEAPPAQTLDSDVDVDDEAIQGPPEEKGDKKPQAAEVGGQEATLRRGIAPVPSDFGARMGAEDSDLIQTVAMATQPTPQGAESGAPTPRDTPGGRFDPIVQQGQFGKYRIINKIGAGGFGKVYLGRDPVLGRDVAVKTCTSEDEALRRRFLREAKIAAGLQHPNIVTVYDFGYEGEIPYMVQEYLDGEDLAEKIGRGDLTLEVKIDYLLRIARGLAHAHENDVLHRDIKPANIRILADGQVRILDFGIARLLNETTAFTTDGTTLGTVGYLAPEILNSDDVDARSDIFSFGVLAYELLSHRRPFTGDSFVRVSYRLLNEEPTPLEKLVPDCPPPLLRMVRICLEKSPGDRYGDFNEIVGILTRLIEDSQARPAAAYSTHDGNAGPAHSASIDDSAMAPAGTSSGRSTLPVSALGSDPPRAWRLPTLIAFLVVITISSIVLMSSSRQSPDGLQPESSLAATGSDTSGGAALNTPQESSRQEPESSPSSPLPSSDAAPSTSGSASGPPAVGQPVDLRSPAAGSGTAVGPGAATGPRRTGANPGPEGSHSSGRIENEQAEPGTPIVTGSVTDSDTDSDSDSDSDSVTDPESSAATAEPVAKTKATLTDESPQAVGPGKPVESRPLDANARLDSSTGPETRPNAGPTGPSGASTSDGSSAIASDTGAPSSESADLESSETSVRVFPQLIEQSQPIYPPRAQRKRVEGTVTLGVRVDAEGKVVRMLVKSSTTQGMGFEQAAKKAAERSRFQPGTIGGEPAAMWAEMVFRFRLPG